MISEDLLIDYLPVLLFVMIAVGLSLAMVLGPVSSEKPNPNPKALNVQKDETEDVAKESAQFDIRFYLVCLLFVVFDIGIVLLFPWAVSLRGIGVFGFWSMVVFLAVLAVGFIYHLKKGVLEWK